MTSHFAKFLCLMAIMFFMSWFPIGQAVNFIIAGAAIWRLTR